MVSSRMLRVGPKFYAFTRQMQEQIVKETNVDPRLVDTPRVTDAIAEFWEQEKLHKIALPRAQKKLKGFRRGGFFS